MLTCFFGNDTLISLSYYAMFLTASGITQINLWMNITLLT